MEEKGDKSIDKLTGKRKTKYLLQLGRDELDIAEEVREGITPESEAKNDLEQIQRVREKLTGSTDETKDSPGK